MRNINKNYSDKEKKEYFLKKSNEFSRENSKLRQSIDNKTFDCIGNVFITDNHYQSNELNKVLSSEKYLKNEYMSKYYSKRYSGIDHDKAVKELKKEFKRKVAITNRDWTNLKLAER